MSQHIPRKRFGQHFLTDLSVIHQCLAEIQARHEDHMVEIGPGLGALTQPLLHQVDHLVLIELDRDIAQYLTQHYPTDRFTLYQQDALQFDFGSLGQSLRVVGNLPYNISTPILFHLLNQIDHISDMHFMLQKEVVLRMVAQPGCADYGRLSVMLQYALHLEYLFTVPAGAFSPPPRVESAFVRAIPYPAPPAIAQDMSLFRTLVNAAFGQRRKTLRNSLAHYLNTSQLEQLGINPTSRAENLSVADFVAICNHIAQT